MRKKKLPYEAAEIVAVLIKHTWPCTSSGRGTTFLVAQSKLNKRPAVPRHTEINDIFARKICKDLGLPPIK